jgi:triosephosphate isomerase
MLIINYKAYPEASGDNFEKLTKKIEKGASKKVVIAPQTADLNKKTELEKFSQHIDSEEGSNTGSNSVKAIKDANVTGTLLNHSEKRLKDEEIEERVKKAQENGLKTVVCAQNPGECKRYSEYSPDYMAFEPPELIGGDMSVASAEPEIIERAVEHSNVPVLTGAGIKTREDVEKSMKLGCEGVLVASGVVKSDKITESVRELCKGL